MKKLILLLLMIVCISSLSLAQKNEPAKPRLIIGIVVDQMRYDFIWRFWDLYGDGGFKRMVNEGFLCKDTRYNYFLTTTAPGHATIYTGTTPALHGIVDNNWYDRSSGQVIYCTTDSSTKTVGDESAAVSSSPFRLETSTVTDELKLVSKESKVIGIAIKDRSAIMPAGHLSDGSYWYDAKTGNWITSTWYMNQLPSWLEQFNKTKAKEDYLDKDWTLLLPRNKYSMCTSDTTAYENPLPGESLPAFPHKMVKGNFNLIIGTPFGNTMTKDVAIEAIKNEQLGKRSATDFLCVSFSSTDLIGHSFGPSSLETADCYLRLDKDIEAFLKFLDEYIGKNNVLIFLTADHGVALNPKFAEDEGLSAGVVQAENLKDKLNQYLSTQFSEGNWIVTAIDQEMYLDKKFIAGTKISEEEVVKKSLEFLSKQEGINCVSAPAFNTSTCSPFIQNKIMNGYQAERSGDILYSLAPGWIDWASSKGSSHGTAYSYDDHVPLIWFGWKVMPGSTSEPVEVTDIAPTLSDWLNFAFPSGCTGKPISFIKLK